MSKFIEVMTRILEEKQAKLIELHAEFDRLDSQDWTPRASALRLEIAEITSQVEAIKYSVDRHNKGGSK